MKVVSKAHWPLLFLVISFTVEISSLWASTLFYRGQAMDKQGKQVYTETHRVELDDKNYPMKASTRYFSNEGELIATLESDFSKEKTAPTHVFKDQRRGELHGLRSTEDNYVLFRQGKEKKEESLEIKKKKFDGLVVGCQGLHYYMLSQMENLKKLKNLSVTFLITGSLDYYDFEVVSIKEKGDIATFEIEISNFFLSLFAPSLIVKYDRRKKHIVYYKGPSNLPSEDGEVQVVEITYDYEKPKA